MCLYVCVYVCVYTYEEKDGETILMSEKRCPYMHKILTVPDSVVQLNHSAE